MEETNVDTKGKSPIKALKGLTSNEDNPNAPTGARYTLQ